VLAVREPGDTPIGDRIRDILLDPASVGMAPATEMLLFAASRAQLVREVIRPHLAQGGLVLCDRYLHSSLAYQAAARGLGRDRVLRANATAIDGLFPDKVILVDLDPEVALNRAKSRAGLDRIEQETLEFHRAVREAFLAEAERVPGRFIVVDGHGDAGEVEALIAPAVEDWLSPGEEAP
jgi:dTMP kinase